MDEWVDGCALTGTTVELQRVLALSAAAIIAIGFAGGRHLAPAMVRVGHRACLYSHLLYCSALPGLQTAAGRTRDGCFHVSQPTSIHPSAIRGRATRDSRRRARNRTGTGRDQGQRWVVAIILSPGGTRDPSHSPVVPVPVLVPPIPLPSPEAICCWWPVLDLYFIWAPSQPFSGHLKSSLQLPAFFVFCRLQFVTSVSSPTGHCFTASFVLVLISPAALPHLRGRFPSPAVQHRSRRGQAPGSGTNTPNVATFPHLQQQGHAIAIATFTSAITTSLALEVALALLLLHFFDVLQISDSEQLIYSSVSNGTAFFLLGPAAAGCIRPSTSQRG
ncbi:hypothetical protein ANO11243_035450 [Dothideomycetidae sp. 11243]|nr:hypothetical protein ANO11243_035450 [fungal sp. No.11243]